MCPLVAPWATDIRDPNCGRTMDPNIDPGSNVRSDVIMNPDRVKATQIGMD